MFEQAVANNSQRIKSAPSERMGMISDKSDESDESDESSSDDDGDGRPMSVLDIRRMASASMNPGTAGSSSTPGPAAARSDDKPRVRHSSLI